MLNSISSMGYLTATPDNNISFGMKRRARKLTSNLITTRREKKVLRTHSSVKQRPASKTGALATRRRTKR